MQIEPRVQRQEMQVAHAGDGIRKVDNLVKEDDLFHQLGLNYNIVGIISQILGTDLKMFRNSLLMKAPEVGSQKGWHQDSPYWPIEPMDLCSCWFTLDDATPENGCLAVLPGWHKRGSLPHISVTDDYVIDPAQCEIPEGILAPVKAGGGVFFHSLSCRTILHPINPVNGGGRLPYPICHLSLGTPVLVTDQLTCTFKVKPIRIVSIDFLTSE